MAGAIVGGGLLASLMIAGVGAANLLLHHDYVGADGALYHHGGLEEDWQQMVEENL